MIQGVVCSPADTRPTFHGFIESSSGVLIKSMTMGEGGGLPF